MILLVLILISILFILYIILLYYNKGVKLIVYNYIDEEFLMESAAPTA
jgi:hypothetical protein